MISKIYTDIKNRLTTYSITEQEQVDERVDSFPRLALYFVDETTEPAVSQGITVGGVDRVAQYSIVAITSDAQPMSAVKMAEEVRDILCPQPSSDDKHWVTVEGCPVAYAAPLLQAEVNDTDTNLAVAILTLTASYRSI